MPLKIYRNGPLGALMDEYERAAHELQRLLEDISDVEYKTIGDTETKDADCRSIQTMMSHVIGAGYGYADHIRKVWNITTARPAVDLPEREEAIAGINDVLRYTAETLEGKWHFTDDDVYAVELSIPWSKYMNLEQLLEHAIAHILRHRRQSERFLQKFSPIE